MQKQAKQYFTPEEYLALEESAEYKSEYYKGEIFAMSGASINHNRIVRNLTVNLDRAFVNYKCEVFSNDMRVWVATKELFTYPDIVVICGAPEFYEDRDDTITNPLLIVEVLSESTKNYDRGEKFEFYRSINSLQEYILIDQYKIHVEQFYIGEEGKWVLTEYNGQQDVLRLFKIDFKISLKDSYQRVDFLA